MSMADSTAAIAATEPTDRSISPSISTNVSPNATIVTKDICLNNMDILYFEKTALLKKKDTNTTRIVANKITTSVCPNILFNID
jgi:hypothetical protein